MPNYYYVKPYDVLFPRGNLYFGSTGGESGQALMPPPPSVFSGAFRSAIAAAHPQILPAVEKGSMPLDDSPAKVLGSLEKPGSFRLITATLAEKNNEKITPLFQMPADLLALPEDKKFNIYALKPQKILGCVKTSLQLPMAPLLCAPQQKPVVGLWLTEKGWNATIAGKLPQTEDIRFSKDLWRTELRLGIALDSATRATAEGKLFNSIAVSLCENVGFLVGIEGAENTVPKSGILRLAGDGRAADYKLCNVELQPPPLNEIKTSGKFRIVMLTSGIFEKGWLLPMIENADGCYRLKSNSFSARLVCAAINGSETISGWNLVQNAPKPAVKAVPAGSVYWFDEFEGDVENLLAWVNDGLQPCGENNSRKTEGFNMAQIGFWIE